MNDLAKVRTTSVAECGNLTMESLESCYKLLGEMAQFYPYLREGAVNSHKQIHKFKSIIGEFQSKVPYLSSFPIIIDEAVEPDVMEFRWSDGRVYIIKLQKS